MNHFCAETTEQSYELNLRFRLSSREEDDYETVSMELDSDPEISKEGKSATQHSEDDVELLRKQLLSQVRKKKAKQQNENIAELEGGKGIEDAASTAKMNELERMREKLSQLNEQLVEAQLMQSAIVRKKRRLHDSLADCEVDLTRSQSQISSIVEAILALWTEATSADLKANLVESKNKPKSREIDRHASQTEKPVAIESFRLANFDEANGKLISPRIREGGGGGTGYRERRVGSSRTRHSKDESAVKKITSHGTNRAKLQARIEGQRPSTSQTKQKELAVDNADQATAVPSITLPSINAKGQMQVDETDYAVRPQQQHEEALAVQPEQQHEEAFPVPPPPLVTEGYRVDSFLASIRAYRLDPRFPHRLLAHHSISNRLDPFVPLCPFQLHGRCADTNCPWQHEEEYRLSEVDIVAGVIALWPSLCPRGLRPGEYATTLLASDPLEIVVGLDPVCGIPRLTSKPIPAEEDIDFVPFLPSKQINQYPQDRIVCAINVSILDGRFSLKKVKEGFIETSKIAMEFLFGKRKTPAEMLRQNQRALNKAIRELDRERQRLEMSEKKIIADIKKMAKMGQMNSVRIMAKDLVRTRQYIKKFVMMRANIQAVSLKVQTLKSQDSMAQAMKGVTRAMRSMNKQLNLPQIQKIMNEFEKQSEIMDMKEEMMDDAIDDAMGDADEEEETDKVVQQVLDELGIQMTEEMGKLPNATDGLSVGAQKDQRQPQAAAAVSGASGGGAASTVSDIDADLQARLENLRRE
uniref:C3H1-type domain-containing protein n=1 Tax=Globodera rostochiensis TaxID=31243 RepID=A0A914I618_GLORO